MLLILTYTGPFSITYRSLLMLKFISIIKKFNVHYTKDFNILNFLGNSMEIMEWNIQGLPLDNFSKENGILTTQAIRFPLIIDPQSQANHWIKSKYENKSLQVIDFQTKKYLQIIQTTVQTGQSILIQDIQETIDPSLNNLLNISSIDHPNYVLIDNAEIAYNPQFKLYFTTKLNNPHYKADIFIKTTIINFAIVKEGLENQLLSLVVKYEQPKLEQDKQNIISQLSTCHRKIEILEQKILESLSF